MEETLRTGKSAGSRLAVALSVAFVIVLSLGPLVAATVLELPLGSYEHTEWLWRLVLSIPVAGLLGVALGALLWSVVKNQGARSLGAIYLLIYVPVAAFMLVGVVNARWDPHAARPVTVRYVGHVPRAKGADLFELTSWTDPQGTIEVTFYVRESDRIPGRPMRLLVHPGALGIEWISDLAPAR